jgi:hypothetical protein
MADGTLLTPVAIAIVLLQCHKTRLVSSTGNSSCSPYTNFSPDAALHWLHCRLSSRILFHVRQEERDVLVVLGSTVL